MFILLGVISSLAACGGGGDATISAVSVYKYAGSVQCTGGGNSLSEMGSQLTAAGIPVISSTCGTDGKVYAAVCGGSDGRIGIFEIAEHHSQAASAVGFASLSNLPDATNIPCQ